MPLSCDLRIELPAQLAGRGVEREHDLVRRAEVDGSPTLIGVASLVVSSGRSGPFMSPVRNFQASLRCLTLAGVICFSGE